MATGWVRAYGEENAAVKTRVSFFKREERAQFRSKFTTSLRKTKSKTSEELSKLKWGDTLELPTGLSSTGWTKAVFKGKTGFIQSSHAVEIGYVNRKPGSKDANFRAILDCERFDTNTHITHPAKKTLIWGDLVQITSRGPQRCEVRVRGTSGKMDTADLANGEPLLDVYFIDVGQGDGVLVRTPDFKHMLIDGGLTRTKQQTGKNAADLVDWKFFFDYGDFKVRLDSLMASHSDSDHYGGLHDLIRDTELSDRELDCLAVDIKSFHHPGLSRWKNVPGANPPHADGLGPKKNGGFVRLLDDRADAESTFQAAATEKLSGPWGRFIKAVLENSKSTKFERVAVPLNDLQSKPLPNLWPKSEGCEVKVLAPVTYQEGGKAALPDLGVKSINTNGHSICLRIDYGKARILLTGDLNTKSMNWLEKCYDDRISAFKCDVAKACHHGSHDVSYRFLEAINAAATIISSGDAEGHSHPRPEIVGASACAGYMHIDRNRDRLVTPLVYMTEIERSVTLGTINRIDIKGMPTNSATVDGAVLGRPLDEVKGKGFLSPDDRKKLKGKTVKKDINKVLRAARTDATTLFGSVEDKTAKGDIRIDVNLDVPLGPVDKKNNTKRLWRGRMMQKTHYGLVNMRTDGKTIMCATLNETESSWIIHTFPARFPEI